jgi:NAD+ synthase (glutamine-hydrolysing)
MRIALAQINPTVGDIVGNTQLIEQSVMRARHKRADLVVFPELAVCGYPPEDLLFKSDFRAANAVAVKKIAASCEDIAAAFGFVREHDGAITNALAFAQNGSLCGIYDKMFLPNYGVFDEKRYFAAGEQAYIVQHEKEKILFTICEDIWVGGDLYAKLKKEHDFTLLVNISSSPYNHGKIKVRERLLKNLAKRLRVPVVYVNTVGGQDELIFDGRSLVVDAQGRVVVQAKAFDEDLLMFDTKKAYAPLAIKEDPTAETYRAVVLGLRDYVRKNGFSRVLVGLSGGIDSALVAAIAVDALGKENVVGVTMPSVYSSKATVSDAGKLAKNLGIEFHTVPIKAMIDTFSDQIMPTIAGEGKWYDLACQNMQSRMRGNVLMTISNRFGLLVLNTGNKSEVSVGYCTLYGDLIGGYSVLKDIYKTNVFKLARYFNALHKKALIPVSTITRAPSAELKADQKDEEDLMPYPLLDAILKCYIEDDLSADEIIAKGFDVHAVRRVVRLVEKNEYKRRQAPIGTRITLRAFGRDRRMPITNRFV